MSDVTERVRKLEEQLTKESLRVKKLERQVEKTQGPAVMLLKALIISLVSAAFIQLLGFELMDNLPAAALPGLGYILLELGVRFYGQRR